MRENNDIHHAIELDLMESLCGWSRAVQTIDGKQLRVEHGGPTPLDWQVRFPALGMPLSKNPSERGYFVVKIKKIKQPKSLTEDEKLALRDTLQNATY